MQNHFGQIILAIILLFAGLSAHADSSVVLTDGRRIVVTNKTCSDCPNPTIQLVDSSGRVLVKLPAAERELIFSSTSVKNGKYFVTSTTAGEGKLRVYDLEKKVLLKTLLPFDSPKIWGAVHDLGGNEFVFVSGPKNTYLKPSNVSNLVFYSILGDKVVEVKRMEFNSYVKNVLSLPNGGLLLTEGREISPGEGQESPMGDTLSWYSVDGVKLQEVDFDRGAEINDLMLNAEGGLDVLVRTGNKFSTVRMVGNEWESAVLSQANERLFLEIESKVFVNTFGGGEFYNLKYRMENRNQIGFYDQDKDLGTIGIKTDATYKRIDSTMNGLVRKVLVGDYNANGDQVFYARYRFANGDYYEGEWIWIFDNTYGRFFLNGIRSGRGIYVWPNGNQYQGGYLLAKRSGYGDTFHANGKIESGIWESDKLVTRCQNSSECNAMKGACTAVNCKVDFARADGTFMQAVEKIPMKPVCRSNEDGTLTGIDGTIWQICLYGQSWKNGECVGTPKNVSWYEAMEAARGNNFSGKNDWVLPSTVFLNGSIHPQSCKHPNIPMYVREYMHGYKDLEVSGHYWTSDTRSRDGGGAVLVTDSRYAGGFNSVFYDTLKSASDFDKAYTSIYAVFVRNTPMADRDKFLAALPLVKCDAKCLASRKAAQNDRDRASVQRGEAFNTKVRDIFSGSSSGSSSSDSNSGSSKATGVASIRSESYDNVGRKTEGYFVRCRGGDETRVYRTAWDSNRAWYKPGGINGYYLASGEASINDVAQSICK
ncbi:MAG: hypothetical protein V4447_07455 [Pseudomonadota bacterium]